LKILTTAIFTRFLLNRRFNIIQWFALILLIIGIAIVEIQVMTSKKVEKDVEPVTGFLAVIVCCKLKLIQI
jgi:UDP-sugar transporter A1/2/3